jgi:ribosome-associated protein
MTALEKAIKIAKILDDKKADEVTVLSVAESSSVWEYYVIASGTSNTHIKALSNEIDEKMKDIERPLHIEGYVSAEWILMDYNDVNVHIFQKDSRMFYSLEKLYQNSQKIDWSAM